MAIRDDVGAANTTRPASAIAPAARPSARTTGPRLDDLAEIDPAGLLDGLPNRRIPQGRRPVAIVARVEPEELDRAGQPVVQTRPSLLDSHRDIEIGEPNEQRPQHAQVEEEQYRADHRGQEHGPDHGIEVEEPVQRIPPQ